MREQANAKVMPRTIKNNRSMSPSTAITSLIAFYVVFNNRLRNPPPAPPPRVEPVSSTGTPTAQNGEASEYPNSISPLVAVKLSGVRGHNIPKTRDVS